MELFDRFRTTAQVGAALCAALVATSDAARAQADPFLGQMMATAANYCPRGWARADGQLLAISSNSALFALLGTNYGGDGRTTFGLPDLRGRVMKHIGTGNGLSPVTQGQSGGRESVQLSQNELPSHSHIVNGVAAGIEADQRGPADDFPGSAHDLQGNDILAYHDGPPNVTMNAAMISPAGGNQAFNIENPFQGMMVCIATVGLFPSRN